MQAFGLLVQTGIYRLTTHCFRRKEMIYKNNITADEVNKLRCAVSFRQIDEAQISAGLSGSALVVSAYEDSYAVGMARLIWDGGMTD